ncbi:hypothetical protein [Cellulosimicrobium funkei]|uniref:hypothetical protein n=1 Tax=Cellulosimicrobium funkei TaxID=264251 RepID=UPI0030F50575
MAEETLPTLPELTHILPVPRSSLVAAFAVGATTEALAQRAVRSLWDSLRDVGTLHVLVTVQKVRQRKPYLLVGRWAGVQRSQTGVDLLVDTERSVSRLVVALSTVDAIAVYAVPAVSDTAGEQP